MKPEAGQWWETSKGRRFKIIGQLQKTGHFVLDDNSGIPDWCPPMAIAECTYLPDCTGFNWVVPEHSRPAEDHQPVVHYDPIADRRQLVLKEDPDEWVIQDKVPPRAHVDQWKWVCHDQRANDVHWSSTQGNFTRYKHGDEADGETLHVRCRRRDLPKVEQAEQWPKYWTTCDATEFAYVEQTSDLDAKFVRKDGSYVVAKWGMAELRKQLTEAEAMELLKKTEPQPQKKRVRLWKNAYGSVMSNPDCENIEGWQELHHDSEGFYTID